MLRHIAASSDIDLTAFFLSDFSTRRYRDAGFGAAVAWDVPLLEGYNHVFLPAVGSTEAITALKPWSTGLRKHLQAGHYDALWLHGYAHPVSLRAMMVAKRLGMKVFVRAESQLGSAARTRGTAALKEAIIRRVFAKVDAFLSIGSLNRDYYRHYGVPAERIYPMPYAVDNAFFQEKSQQANAHREVFRSELGLSTGRPIILFASKFIARKRAVDVLEAYAKLSPDGTREPHPYLLFVGDGEQRAELEARASQFDWASIRFLGFKNQTELPAFYDLCDVFVLVSEGEPWGLIVNEVMNAGKAVIISDQVGCGPDLVQNGQNGYIVPTGNIAALASCLESVTSTPGCANTMGKQSLSIIKGWSYEQDLTGLLSALNAACRIQGES